MAKQVSVPLDPVTVGKDRATVSHVEDRFNRFQNKNTFWRHTQNGTMAEFDQLFDEAVARVRASVSKPKGNVHTLVIDGLTPKSKATFATKSPAEHDLCLGHWAAGTKTDARKAIAAAKKGFPAWSATRWQDRVAIIEKAADLFTESFYDLCAVMSLEAGKTRYEASIDVDEAVDFLRFYALTMREMGGFDMEMGKPVPTESCRSIRKPWGVFAVVCPFNFPIAITAGMTVAALITGNTAVLKPSGKGCLSGWWVFSLLKKAGIPDSALHFLTTADHDISTELLTSPDVDGLVFTGSKKVGMMAWQTAAEHGRPKPMIAEMGGKNAIVVSDKADLDKAVQGVFRSAFGFQGQKCSACSRVYVHKKVAKEFTDRLVKLTEAATVGLPWLKTSYMGPVIDESKAEFFASVLADVKKSNGKVLAGGVRIAKDAKGKALAGNYVRPTIVGGLPLDHRVFREEFFMPFVAVGEVKSYAEGIKQANAVEYGLTAGTFTEDDAEAKQFFDTIEAGVTYLNRAAGGSTAAVVNGQAFVGWKNSGSTGNGAGGRYYLLQFTREQARTIAG
ncbi:MAG: aldehyde dehydrogenase family protein [Candidatus Thermoplasmatota archaeon]|jgi:1-pyrroline-5-carboxylate dehydrogenase